MLEALWWEETSSWKLWWKWQQTWAASDARSKRRTKERATKVFHLKKRDSRSPVLHVHEARCPLCTYYMYTACYVKLKQTSKSKVNRFKLCCLKPSNEQVLPRVDFICRWAIHRTLPLRKSCFDAGCRQASFGNSSMANARPSLAVVWPMYGDSNKCMYLAMAIRAIYYKLSTYLHVSYWIGFLVVWLWSMLLLRSSNVSTRNSLQPKTPANNTKGHATRLRLH